MGTFQSTLTNFRYIRKQWSINCEEERLLGVSLTGILDNKFLSQTTTDVAIFLNEARKVAIDANKEWAKRIGINPSVAVSTVKPSGTVSQLVDSASGIHPRHNPFYIRTVRADEKDPLCAFLKDQGVPGEQDVTNKSNWVFSFPCKAPQGSINRSDRTAIEQLEHYLLFKQEWCEHNPSITVYVKEHEWLEVGAWVYKHLDDIGGVSFLPHSDFVYAQAPYQDITEEQYNVLVKEFPEIDWKAFDKYETDDAQVNYHEYACIGGSCEII